MSWIRACLRPESTQIKDIGGEEILYHLRKPDLPKQPRDLFKRRTDRLWSFTDSSIGYERVLQDRIEVLTPIGLPSLSISHIDSPGRPGRDYLEI